VWGVRRGLLASRGLVGAGAMSLLYIILGRMPLGDATTLHYTAPIWTAILAAVFLGERLRPVVFAGTALCLVGVGLVAQPSFLFGSGAEALDPGMVALALAGAVLSAFAYTFVRTLRTTDHPLTIVFYLALGGIALSVPFTAGWQWPSLWAWAALAGIGASTQIAQLALTKGLHLLEAGPATAIGHLQIVFAFGWGVLFFGEVPDGLSLVGALVIVSSLLLVIRRPKALPPPSEASAEAGPEALEAYPVDAEAFEASPAVR
jgi:drug/metabolite transporter (DMT)-like permease